MPRISSTPPSYPSREPKGSSPVSFFELPSPGSVELAKPKINSLTMNVLMRQMRESIKRIIILHTMKGESSHMKNKPVNEEVEKAIESFVETYIESLRESYNNPLEPFEAYSNRMRAEIYRDAAQFKERFKRGFHILMEEIQKEKKS